MLRLVWKGLLKSVLTLTMNVRRKSVQHVMCPIKDLMQLGNGERVTKIKWHLWKPLPLKNQKYPISKSTAVS